MDQKFIDIGYSSYINASRIVSVLNPDSDPIRRQIKLAEKEGRLCKATFGRKAESMLVMDNGIVYLSALQTKTIIERIEGSNKKSS